MTDAEAKAISMQTQTMRVAKAIGQSVRIQHLLKTGHRIVAVGEVQSGWCRVRKMGWFKRRFVYVDVDKKFPSTWMSWAVPIKVWL